MHKLKLRDALGDDSTKPVGVDVEKCKISQQPQLCRQVPSNVSMVEINTSNHLHLGVIERGSAEDSIIGTHISTNPVAGRVKWVRIDSLLPCLKSNVSSPEPLVFKSHVKVDLRLVVIGKIAIFMEG